LVRSGFFRQVNFKENGWPSNVGGVYDVIVTIQAVHELRHKRHALKFYKECRGLLDEDELLFVCDRLPQDDSERDRALFMTDDEQLPIFTGIHWQPIPDSPGELLLMVAVFQLDLAILLGQLKAAVLTPYTVISIIPALAGIVGDRYLRVCKLANALLIAAVFWLGGVLLAFQSQGRFMPLSFLTGIFVSRVSSSRR